MDHDQNCTPETPLLAGWISRADLAVELDVSVDTMARWETTKTGPKQVKVGRRVLYRRAAVLEWLKSLEQGGAGDAR